MSLPVNICDLPSLKKTAIEWDPATIVSAVEVEVADWSQLRVPILDVLNGQIWAYKDAIRKVLREPKDRRLLFHCEHGRSRSAALALIRLYQVAPSLIPQFFEEHPEAEPNPLLLLFGDEILEANGDLLKACSMRY